MTKNYKVLFLSCVIFFNPSFAMSSETGYVDEGYTPPVNRKSSKNHPSRLSTTADIQKNIREHQDKIEELLANYKTTQKERESVYRHIEEITSFSEKLESLFKDSIYLTPSDLETNFNNLVSSMTVIKTHPSGYLPKVVSLCPVPGFFTGTLNDKKTCGLISGSVNDPSVIEKEKRTIFSVKVGSQNFNGEISADPASRGILKLISATSQDNVISFNLDPDFFANSSTSEKVSQAWKNLFGISRNNGASPRFFSASSEVPDGLKFERKKCPAYTLTYKANPTLLPLAFASPSHEVGVFCIKDGTSKQYYKTFTMGTVEKAFKENKNLDFFTPHSLVKVDVLPSFDFNKTWSVPLVIENNLILINPWRTSYTFSLLEDNKKVDYGLNSSDFWKDLLKLDTEFSGERWTPENKLDRIEEIENYFKKIKTNLSLLEHYKTVLERTLKKEELKLTREGIVLSQSD